MVSPKAIFLKFSEDELLLNHFWLDRGSVL